MDIKIIQSDSLSISLGISDERAKELLTKLKNCSLSSNSISETLQKAVKGLSEEEACFICYVFGEKISEISILQRAIEKAVKKMTELESSEPHAVKG